MSALIAASGAVLGTSLLAKHFHMKDVWNWLMTSSADPEQTSMFIKGILIVGGGKLLSILTALCGLGLICLGIDAGWLQAGAEAIAHLVLGVLYIVGFIVAARGLWRKIKLGRWSAA